MIEHIIPGLFRGLRYVYVEADPPIPPVGYPSCLGRSSTICFPMSGDPCQGNSGATQGNPAVFPRPFDS